MTRCASNPEQRAGHALRAALDALREQVHNQASDTAITRADLSRYAEELRALQALTVKPSVFVSWLGALRACSQGWLFLHTHTPGNMGHQMRLVARPCRFRPLRCTLGGAGGSTVEQVYSP